MKRRFRRGISMLLCLMTTLSCAAAGGALRAAAITAADAAAWAKAQGDQRAAFDLDAHYGYQCSDFVTAYMNYLVDGDPRSGRYQVYDAREYPDVAAQEPERWTVLRGAAMKPRPGDIFVSAGRDPTFGHAGVILGQVGGRYRIVDQNSNPVNFDKGSPCYTHEVTLSNDFALKALIRYQFDPDAVTLTYHANGGENAPASQTGYGAVRLSAAVPTRAGYDFLGWAENAAAAAAQYQPGAEFNLTRNVTLYAVWKATGDPDTPPGPDDPDPPVAENPTAHAALYVPAAATVEYQADVTVTARADGVPAGFTLAVYDGNRLCTVGSNETVSYHVGSVTSGKTLTVKVTDAAGAVQKDGSGAELSRSVEIKVSNSFFARLIAFFKGLLGLLPHVELRP